MPPVGVRAFDLVLDSGASVAGGSWMLAAVLLATPIFGFALQLQASPAVPATPATSEVAPLEAAMEEPGASAAPSNDVADQMSRRARIARIHRAMGIATWGAMTATTVLGTIQYYNLYGFFADQSRTPCVTGDAIGGLDACTGSPILHGVSGGVTGLLYYTTFGLSYAMPDPLGLDRGNSEAARRLRRHKRLRWAHFGGMAAQALLGVVIANDQAFGLDRANHFRALQSLATVHMVVGYATYATLTWSGAIMMRR